MRHGVRPSNGVLGPDGHGRAGTKGTKNTSRSQEKAGKSQVATGKSQVAKPSGRQREGRVSRVRVRAYVLCRWA